MKTTFRYVFKYTELNSRLGEKKNRTKTLHLTRELFDHYDVEGMVRAFRSESDKFTYHDSTVIVKSIRVGRTEFQL